MKLTPVFLFFIYAATLCVSAVTSAAETSSLEVIDPYLEMRSGPGRGYPVFYTVEEGEQVEIIVRQPGWYEIRSANNRQGWVAESQIARTMQKSGEPADLPTVSYGDYLKRGWQVGFGTGQISGAGIEKSDNLKVTLGFRPLAWLVVEAETARFFAPETRGGYTGLNVVFEPFSDNRWSPALLLGSGSLNIEAQPELVPLDIDDASYKHYGLRLNYYVGRNFLINAEYKQFDVDIASTSEEMEAWYIGFNTFF